MILKTTKEYQLVETSPPHWSKRIRSHFSIFQQPQLFQQRLPVLFLRSKFFTMTEILKKYKETGNFKFKISDSLKEMAYDVPNRQSGVYLIYDATGKNKNLIYIGSSGHIQNDGLLHTRISGGGGIKDRIINGHQFGNSKEHKRYLSWPKQMGIDKIDCLEIHWFITYNCDFKDSPSYVEHLLLHEYYTEYKKLPKWTKKF